MLWGFDLAIWELWGVRLMFAGAFVGVIALALSLASAFILWFSSTKSQERLERDVASANAEVARANASAEEARLELEKVKKEAALANERAEAAKAEAAKANERILKMQQLRRLDKAKAAALVPLLKSELFQAAPKPCLRVGSVKDAEAQMYAMDFQRLFESCGVNIYPTDGGHPNELVQLEPNPDGLLLRIKSKETAHQAIVRFQRLVHSLGINIPVVEDPTLRDNESMLAILRKPD
jgi:hypothetical protein